MSEEFDDWHLNVSLDGEEVKFLCCPEDVQCLGADGFQHRKTECCEKCVAPICSQCKQSLSERTPKLPPASLANDMMIFYPPKYCMKRK